MRRNSNLLDHRIKRLHGQIERSLSANSPVVDDLIELSILLFKQGMISELCLDQIEALIRKTERVIALGNASPFPGEASTCCQKATALCQRTMITLNAECHLDLLVSTGSSNIRGGISEMIRMAKHDPRLFTALDELLTKYGISSKDFA